MKQCFGSSALDICIESNWRFLQRGMRVRVTNGQMFSFVAWSFRFSALFLCFRPRSSYITVAPTLLSSTNDKQARLRKEKKKGEKKKPVSIHGLFACLRKVQIQQFLPRHQYDTTTHQNPLRLRL